jgi:hypothetical protein
MLLNVLLAFALLLAGADARDLLYSRAEKRTANAAAAQQLTSDLIATAATGDLPVSAATAPNRLAVMMHSDVAGRMLISKMDQREANAAAAGRLSAARIEAAADGNTAVSDATAPEAVRSALHERFGRHMLEDKMDQLESNAAAAGQLTAARIEAAAEGNMAVSGATAPETASAVLHERFGCRMLYSKMDQREGNAAAASQFTAARIETAAEGNMAGSDATAPEAVQAALLERFGRRMLYSKMDQREGNAAAAGQLTAARIETAAEGNMAVSDATAPEAVRAALLERFGRRMLEDKMDQREGDAAAAGQLTAARIEAAAAGNMPVSDATAPEAVAVMMHGGRKLAEESSKQQQQQQQQPAESA